MAPEAAPGAFWLQQDQDCEGVTEGSLIIEGGSLKSVFSLIGTIWNIGVVLFGLTCFGGFARLTYELGMSALSLHQRGMVSLTRFNCSLQGDKLGEECKPVRRANRRVGQR